MNAWSNTVLTDKGRALLAKLTQGNTLNITKSMTGSGFVTPGLLAKQTGITDPKQTLDFRPVSYPETGKCVLPVALTNDGLVTGYTATQVGIYATDPDEGEILFFISQAADAEKGTIIPSETEMPGYAAEWTFYLAYGQADKVEVTVDQTGTVSREELEERLKKCATLDADGKVPEEQLPDTTYIPVTSEVPSDSDIWIDPEETTIEEAHVVDRNNPHGVTIEQIGAAPAGYGLGKTEGRWADDLNTATEQGWYYTTANTKNVPAFVGSGNSGWNYASVFVKRRYSEIFQFLTVPYNGQTVHAVRSSLDGGVTWGELEYANPPIELGVEYRTTERLNGKPVYVMQVACGKLGENTTITATLPHSDALTDSIIRCSGYCTGGFLPITIPYEARTSTNDIQSISCDGSANTIFLNTVGDYSQYDAYVTAWFIKN